MTVLDRASAPLFPTIPTDSALNPRALAAVTRAFARRLLAGDLGPVHYGDPDRPGERWHVRVHADALVDVWVISWLPEQGTRLHDHGGSSGAFTVVQGSLTEAAWSPATAGRGRLVDHVHATGRTVAFGPERVHDVRNLHAAPALSVHAYSTPLLRMGFYDLLDGALHQTSVLDTSDPEATQ